MSREQAEALLAYVDAAIERSQPGAGLGAWQRAQNLREAVLALCDEPAGAGEPKRPLVDNCRWQCSGCRWVFEMPWREKCPECGAEDEWTGSVAPDGVVWIEPPPEPRLTLEAARAAVGRRVRYTPLGLDPEGEGTITSVNDSYVFVRFGLKEHGDGIACTAADLVLLP